MAKRSGAVGPERIAEPLLPLAVPIDSVHEDPANARIHPERNLEAIEASLVRFGQRIPIVVQRDGMVVRAGNARLRVARELGWKRIAAVVVEEPSIEAVAFAIADNRTAELAGWDDEALARILEEIRNDGSIDLSDIGYSAGELDEILEELAKKAAPPDEFPGVDEDLPTEYKCPNCGYEWSGKTWPSEDDADGSGGDEGFQ